MGPRAGDLRTIPLFHGFDDAELAALARLFTPATIAAGAPLFDVGEPATDLYLLTSGEVVLDRPEDDVFRLYPPALIGELGALTGLRRSTRATPSPGATVWALPAKAIQTHFKDHQELGVRFLVNLLGVVADKVHRDQRRTGDMRQHVIRTQKELKRLREVVLEAAETPISAPVHDSIHRLITHNRRVNYRVEPPPAHAATLRIDAGTVPILDLSRTHLSIRAPRDAEAALAAGTWLAGVLALPGIELPISGRVFRTDGDRVTIQLDLLIDEYAAILEGYLTRVQLLDILV